MPYKLPQKVVFSHARTIKKEITGRLKEVAKQRIDLQTDTLVSMIGDSQIDYRFLLALN